MTDTIFSIDELKKQSQPIIAIPNFDNTGTINVRVQRPRLLDMAKRGDIPNHLIGIAHQMLTGKQDTGKMDNKKALQRTASIMELYTRACLVEPSYDDFKEIMTDEQGDTIFSWAMGMVSTLDSFRADTKDDTSDTNESEISKES